MKIKLKMQILTFFSALLILTAGCGGSAGTSGTSVVTPSAPGAATITIADSQLSLSWAAIDGATAYEVWYSGINDSSSATRSGGDITGTSYIISWLTNGTTYYIWLKAKNSAGISDFGPVASGTPDEYSLGDIVSVTVGSTSFNMSYANNSTSMSFPTKTTDLGVEILTRKFFIAETETTNTLMKEVLQWAYDNSKFSTTVSDPNGLDSTIAKYGNQPLIDLDDADCHISYSGGTFSVDVGYENNPVTNVTWFGAIMFTNWLTEMKDGNTDNLVYTGINTTSWSDTDTVEDTSKTGYRLPSTDEWEYAARYRNDSTNTVSGYANPYFTKGNSASGAYTYYNDENDTNPANGVVDNKDTNDVVAVYYYYYDGGWQDKGTSDEAAVKSLGAGSANSLGLYDMSGNVSEWCFTATGVHRFVHGGSWFGSAEHLQVGHSISHNYPEDEYGSQGFRIVRTH